MGIQLLRCGALEIMKKQNRQVLLSTRNGDGWNRCETDVINHKFDVESILDAV